MRVCSLATSFPRFEKDVRAVFIRRWAEVLGASGLDMHIVAPDDADVDDAWKLKHNVIHRFRYMPLRKWQKLAYQKSGIPENLKSSLLAKLQVPFFLLCFLRKAYRVARRSDIIHAHWIASGLVAIVANKILGIPVVLTVHNAGLRSYPRLLSKFVIRNVDAVISPHPELTDIVKSYEYDNVYQVPNLIDMEKFRAVSSAETDQLKLELNLTNEKVVTYVGRLTAWKEPLIFVKAIPHVIAADDNVVFLLVGDGPLLDTCKRTARRLGIEKSIRIVGPRSDVNALLHISSIFTALSNLENIWSTTLIEAMVSGVPCIVTRAGYTERVLTHRENAFLIPPSDEKEVARAIVTLLGDDVLGRRLAEKGKVLVRRWGFEKENVIKKMLQIYKDAMNPI